MKTSAKNSFVGLFVSALTFLASISAFGSADPVQLGKVEFLVDTNVKMFQFKGEAKELHSKLERNGSQLKSVEISIPVDSLKTGMDMRDRHMKARIFTKKDGTTPDVTFKGDKSDCKPGEAASVLKCEVQGKLSIRGESRPQTLSLVLKDGSTAQGETLVELSKFGIEAPAHAGIKVSNIVKVSFEVKLQ
jgi:polyisoprenoid-binding protein YceI